MNVLDDSQPASQTTAPVAQESAPIAPTAPTAPVNAPIAPSSPSLRDALPESLRENSSLTKFKSVEDLANSYTHLESKLGSMFSLPSEDSAPEKWKEFEDRVVSTGKFIKAPKDETELQGVLRQFGLPESPDKYQLQVDPQSVDQSVLQQFAPVAHKLGLTNQQLNELIKFDVERMNQGVQQMDQMKASSVAALKKEYGPDFDNRLQGAKLALKHYEAKFPSEVQLIKNSPLGNNPIVIDALAQLGASLRESGAIQGAPQYGMTAQQARDKIAEIKDNFKAHPAFNPHDPRHAEESERLRKLYEIAYSE
jgi:hypothetical protein